MQVTLTLCTVASLNSLQAVRFKFRYPPSPGLLTSYYPIRFHSPVAPLLQTTHHVFLHLPRSNTNSHLPHLVPPHHLPYPIPYSKPDLHQRRRRRLHIHALKPTLSPRHSARSHRTRLPRPLGSPRRLLRSQRSHDPTFGRARSV